MGKIGAFVDKGKSLIVCVDSAISSFTFPGNSWVQVRGVSTPSEWTEYQIVESPLTQNVKHIYGSSVSFLLYGGYPLVLSPHATDFPSTPGALAVYGYYGNGKYAIVTDYITGDCSPQKVAGDVGILMNNILHWLINREIPPPPSVEQVYRSVTELNDTISFLYQKASDIEAKLNELDIGDINSDISSLKHNISMLNDQIKDLTNELDTLSNKVRIYQDEIKRLEGTPNFSQYLSLLSMLLALASIAIAVKKR